MSKVRVLVENTDINKNGIYRFENGLSLLIEYDGKNILFDTGQSDAFMLKAKQIDFNIRDIDYLIISHAHFDHGGGLRTFLKNNTKARFFYIKKPS